MQQEFAKPTPTKRLDVARRIVEGTVGVLEGLTLEERVLEAFEADKKAFAKRVREELLPQHCAEAGDQCCVVCYKKHLDAWRGIETLCDTL